MLPNRLIPASNGSLHAYQDTKHTIKEIKGVLAVGMPELIHEAMRDAGRTLVREMLYSAKEAQVMLKSASEGSATNAFNEQFAVQLEGLTPPSEKTLKRWKDEPMPTAGSEKWHITDTSTKDLPIVLAMLRLVVHMSDGHRQSLTRDEANFAVTIFHAAPEVASAPRQLWALMQTYRDRMEVGANCSDLDILLAMAPWKDTEHLRSYWLLIFEGTLTLPRLRPESEATLWTAIVGFEPLRAILKDGSTMLTKPPFNVLNRLVTAHPLRKNVDFSSGESFKESFYQMLKEAAGETVEDVQDFSPLPVKQKGMDKKLGFRAARKRALEHGEILVSKPRESEPDKES